jgi:hypothetical protein
VENDFTLPGHRFRGMLLLGGLRWIDGMRSWRTSGAPSAAAREPLDVDHVEAAACMAWVILEADPAPDPQSHPLELLLELVNGILGEADFDTVDRERLRAAVDRLRTLGCLTPQAGWYGLREAIEFQVPEE